MPLTLDRLPNVLLLHCCSLVYLSDQFRVASCCKTTHRILSKTLTTLLHKARSSEPVCSDFLWLDDVEDSPSRGRGMDRRDGRIVCLKKIAADEPYTMPALASLSCPFISQCLAVVKTAVDDDLMVVSEFHSRGSLESLLRSLSSVGVSGLQGLPDEKTPDVLEWEEKHDMSSRDGTLNEDEIRCIVRMILVALNCLHKLNYLYHHLQTSKVLFTDDGCVKLACPVEKDIPSRPRHGFIGTPLFMAPEALRQHGSNRSRDVWSLGICAFQMALGHVPLENVHPMRALFMIGCDKFPPPQLPPGPQFSPAFHSFMEKCLQVKPEHRAKTAELLQHPFIVGASGKALEADSHEVRPSETQIVRQLFQKTKTPRRTSTGPVFFTDVR